jgi:hypothetical protein
MVLAKEGNCMTDQQDQNSDTNHSQSAGTGSCTHSDGGEGNGRGSSFDDFDNPFTAENGADDWRADLPTEAEVMSKPTSVYRPQKLRALVRLRDTDLEEYFDLTNRLISAAADPSVTRTKLDRHVQTESYKMQREAREAGADIAEKASQADQLIALAEHSTFGHTTEGSAYARCPVGDHLETFAVDSVPFKQWLRAGFYRKNRRSPKDDALREAVDTLAARALFDGPEIKVFVRIGEHEDRRYLDVGSADWSAIEIVPGVGWHAVATSPVWFIRSKGAQALPVPAPGGSIDELRPFLNTSDNDGFILTVGHLVGAFCPEGPFANLVFVGAQGAAKTTAQRVHRRLVDPHKAESRVLQTRKQTSCSLPNGAGSRASTMCPPSAKRSVTPCAGYVQKAQ